MEITMTRKKRYIIVIRSMIFRREIAFWKMKESVLRKNLSLFLYTQNIFWVNWTGISIVCHKRWTCLHLRLNSMNLPLLMSNVSSNRNFFLCVMRAIPCRCTKIRSTGQSEIDTILSFSCFSYGHWGKA